METIKKIKMFDENGILTPEALLIINDSAFQLRWRMKKEVSLNPDAKDDEIIIIQNQGISSQRIQNSLTFYLLLSADCHAGCNQLSSWALFAGFWLGQPSALQASFRTICVASGLVRAVLVTAAAGAIFRIRQNSRHCEGAKRPKQSRNSRIRQLLPPLPQSPKGRSRILKDKFGIPRDCFASLAMTKILEFPSCLPPLP